ADVQNRRQLALDLLGAVEVAGDVQSRLALEVQFLDHDAIALEFAGDGRLQRRALRQRPETEHVEGFLGKAGFPLLPLLARSGAIEKALADLPGLLLEVGVDHRVAGGFLRLLSKEKVASAEGGEQ